MSIIAFIIFAGVVLLALFLAVKTVQSVAKLMVTLALLGFIAMVGVMIAFSLGFGEMKSVAALKEKAAGIAGTAAGMFQPIGKAMGFFSSRNVISEARKELGMLTRSGNKTENKANKQKIKG